MPKRADKTTDLERENAELRRQLAESVAQQQAVGDVLGVINASPGDLAPVFDAMLENAMRLCDAAFGQLALFDGNFFRFVAARGAPEVAEQLFAAGSIAPSQGFTWPSQARGANTVHVADIKDAEAYRVGNSAAREFWDNAGARTLLSVSLRRGETLLGTITVYRRVIRPFTDQQIALLHNFAAQAVIAMENARLITETQEALEQQTATAEVLQVINSSPGDLAPVFDAILQKAHRLCEASRGTLFLFDGEIFRAAATHGYPPPAEETPPRTIKLSEDLRLGALFAGERLIHVPDLSQLDDPIARSVSKRGGVRTNLLLPLRKDGALLGVLSCNRPEVRPFTDKQIALLQNFAAQAVIAMENARLLGELRQRTDEVAELNRGLEARVAEQVEELGRVGQLKRFLPPQVAELIVSQGDEKILESHRREIVVVFADLRGYTAFSGSAEPEEVIELLREFHAALGPLITRFEGTLSHFFGDGLMVFFNDPVPIPDPAARAVRMAIAMRDAAGVLVAAWRRRGAQLGFGVGIAQGYATLGQIGFAERADYTAIGTVTNLASRLCDAASDGQILLSQRVAAELDGDIDIQEIDTLTLKGVTQPVVAFNVAAAGGGRPVRSGVV